MSVIRKLRAKVKQVTRLTDEAGQLYVSEVQHIADKYQVHICTGIMSDVWQVSEDGKTNWIREYDDEAADHPVFKALDKLDSLGELIGLRPSNMERYTPTPRL